MLPHAMTISDLLARFVDTFVRLDERRVSRRFRIAGDVLSVLDQPWDEAGWSTWSPITCDVPRQAVAKDLSGLARGPVPPLYEQLVLSYRWAAVDVGRVSLFANLPPGLKGLASEIQRDRGLYDALSPAGYLQFGRGPGGDYDPVCFDLARRRLPDGDCRIVKFDHEEILCNGRLVEVAELAPSFRQLIQAVIDEADHAI